MTFKMVITSLIATVIGISALAHSGATGVVKERMDGMLALGQTIKDLSPMMRGQAELDEDAIRAGADVMISHAGEQMTRLFPEGSGGMPSEALPTVWEDWEEFAALAEQLERYAEGLKLSASNGRAADQNTQANTMMGDTSGSMMGGDMMGSGGPMTLEMFATMPVDAAFAAVVETCSACHQQFRAEEN